MLLKIVVYTLRQEDTLLNEWELLIMKKQIIALTTAVLLVLTGSFAFATDSMQKGDGYIAASSQDQMKQKGDDMMKHDHDQMKQKGDDMKQKGDDMMKHDHDQMKQKGDDMMKQKGDDMKQKGDDMMKHDQSTSGKS